MTGMRATSLVRGLSLGRRAVGSCRLDLIAHQDKPLFPSGHWATCTVYRADCNVGATRFLPGRSARLGCTRVLRISKCMCTVR